MKTCRNFLQLILILLVLVNLVFAQAESGIKRVTTNFTNYVYDVSGDGRFAVIESTGNIATHNPRNADGNREVFLFDYAQRHIFQLTDTKSALRDVNISPIQQSNILVSVVSHHPHISNDGRWIAISSNATTSTPSSPNNTNPGNFDGNSPGAAQILQQDGNTELWLYQLPSFQTIDISLGDTPPFVDLGIGSFTRITNTLASRFPSPGTTTNSPVIADDNREPSIDDNGMTVAFISNRDLVQGGNASPDGNDEIFVYKRIVTQVHISQVTRTTRGTVTFPFYNQGPSISGDGKRVVFHSNATNPTIGMSGGCNPDFKLQIYFSDLDDFGYPDGTKRQITFFNLPNDYSARVFLDYLARNISRDGRYMIIVSRGKLSTPGDETLETEFANFIYDSAVPPSMMQCTRNASQFRQIGPRFNADPSLPVGEPDRKLRFTDYDPATLSPGSVVFASRINFRADGTVPPLNSGEGLNQNQARPSQIYAYSLSSFTFTRLTNSPSIDFARAMFPLPSNTKNRIITGIVNETNNSAVFYLLNPNVTQEDTNFQFNFFTGASSLPINSTPPVAQGLMPNMLGSVAFSSQLVPNTNGFATNVSNSRQFAAPLQLRGVTVSIDGIAVPVTGVTNGRINFIVPPEVTPGNKSFVVNHNGVILRGTIQIISSPQPDILTNLTEPVPAPGGRARILNVTDPNNPTPEPFSITTYTPSGFVPTRLRLFVTGVQGVTAGSVSIQIGNVTVPPSAILTNAVATDYPGIFTFDFILPQELAAAGNVPIVLSVYHNGQTIQSRTSNPPRLQINANQLPPDDIAVWRPGSGGNSSTWYILNSQQQIVAYQFGVGTDTPITRDFDGDGRTDFCVYRSSNHTWHIIKSSDGSYYSVVYGSNNDIPAPADYDGDGKADIAVWRPSDGGWYIIQSSNNAFTSQFFGTDGDAPEAADFDADGKADLAVWRNGAGSFYVKRSSDGGLTGYSYGLLAGDEPVIGDYDGDGKADYATRRPSDGVWRIHHSSTNALENVTWGISSDFAVQGNYSDGDSKTDIAVWRPSDGNWYIRRSTNGTQRTVQWGQAGDIPVPAPYRR